MVSGTAEGIHQQGRIQDPESQVTPDTRVSFLPRRHHGARSLVRPSHRSLSGSPLSLPRQPGRETVYTRGPAWMSTVINHAITSLAMRKSAGWRGTLCRQQQWPENQAVEAGRPAPWRRTSWPVIQPCSQDGQPLGHPAWRFLTRPQANKLYSTQECFCDLR